MIVLFRRFMRAIASAGRSHLFTYTRLTPRPSRIAQSILSGSPPISAGLDTKNVMWIKRIVVVCGSGAFYCASALAQNCDTQDILRRVLALPITTWNLKAQDPAIRHMGPTSQDFRAAFGLGETELGMNTLDADGVALAAI